MPLRSEVLVKRWSTVNPPILPFLAPRVFQPWPASNGRHRKVHIAAEPAQTRAEGASQTFDSLQQIDDTISQVKLRTRWMRASSKQSSTSKTEKPTANSHRQECEVTSGADYGNSPNQVSKSAPRHSSSGETNTSARQETYSSKIKGAEPYTPNIGKIHEVEGNGSVKIEGDRYQNWQSPLESRSRKQRDDSSQNTVQEVGSLGSSKLRRVRSKPSGSANSGADRALFSALMLLEEDILRKEWLNLAPKDRSRLWLKFMQMTVRLNPRLSFKFLAATSTDPSVSIQPLSTGINYFIYHKLKDRRTAERLAQNNSLSIIDGVDLGSLGEIHVRTGGYDDDVQHHMDSDLDVTKSGLVEEVTADELKTAIMDVLKQNKFRHLSVGQVPIYKLLANLSDIQAEALYNELKELGHFLHPQTLLQFASRFAKRDALGVNKSIEILKELAKGDSNLDDASVMSLCTTILHRSIHSHQDLAGRVQDLLDLGLNFNVIIYNVLVYNAVQTGDWETAWKIHQMMVESNVSPDVYTYSILLRDAKRRMDSVAIQKTVALATERGLEKNPYIVTDLLHLTLLINENQERERRYGEGGDGNLAEVTFRRSTRRKETFRKILAKFAEHFRIDKLRLLVPSSILYEYQLADQRKSGKFDNPSEPTLQVMLTGLLWTLDSTQTKLLYDRFIHLINRRDPTALALAGEAHTWSLWLMSLGRFSDRLSDCPQLIKKMLNLKEELEAEAESANPAQRVKSSRPRSLQIPDPNVYTWSILVHIFTRHKQLLAAEKIITAMQSRGTKPNKVTWTSLTWGYSRAQEVGKVANTIHRMKTTGHEVGDIAMRAMLNVSDQSGLRKALAKLQEKQEADRALQIGSQTHDASPSSPTLLDSKNVSEEQQHYSLIASDIASAENVTLKDLGKPV